MLKWLAVFAVVLACLPVHGRAESRTASTDQKKTQTIEQKSPESPSISILNSVSQQAPQAEGNGAENHAKSYLSRLFSPENLPNIFLFLAGVVGIVIANRTLKAIKRQADLMDGTAKRQLRAYLGISKSLVKFTEDGALEAQFHFKNAGQTPAYEVKVWRWAIVREYPLVEPLPHPAITPIRTSGMLSPQDKRIIVAEKFNAPDVVIRAINTPTAAFFVYGEIAYKDVFGDSYTLEYRMIYGGPAGTRTFKDTNGVTCGRLCMDADGNQERKT